LRSNVGLHVCEYGVIVNGFDQPSPEDRGRNAKHHILASDCGAEIRLMKKTARRIVSAGDGKERMHSTVGCTVRVGLESGFANWTVSLNKRGDLVVRPFFLRNLDLRINGWTAPSYSRLRMTPGATVQVEARAKPRFCVWNRT